MDNHPLHAMLLGAVVTYFRGPYVGAAGAAATWFYMSRYGHGLPGATAVHLGPTAAPTTVPAAVTAPTAVTNRRRKYVVTDK